MINRNDVRLNMFTTRLLISVRLFNAWLHIHKGSLFNTFQIKYFSANYLPNNKSWIIIVSAAWPVLPQKPIFHKVNFVLFSDWVTRGCLSSGTGGCRKWTQQLFGHILRFVHTHPCHLPRSLPSAKQMPLCPGKFRLVSQSSESFMPNLKLVLSTVNLPKTGYFGSLKPTNV